MTSLLILCWFLTVLFSVVSLYCVHRGFREGEDSLIGLALIIVVMGIFVAGPTWSFYLGALDDFQSGQVDVVVNTATNTCEIVND